MIRFLASLLALAVFTAGPATNRQAPQSSGDAKPPAQETFIGCVQRAPEATGNKTVFVMSGKNFCARLTGTFAAEKLAGHQATVRGTMTAASANQPAEIHVTSVTTIGETCSDACALLPPGGRGVKKRGELPGREGGTPGMYTPSSPQ